MSKGKLIIRACFSGLLEFALLLPLAFTISHIILPMPYSWLIMASWLGMYVLGALFSAFISNRRGLYITVAAVISVLGAYAFAIHSIHFGLWGIVVILAIFVPFVFSFSRGALLYGSYWEKAFSPGMMVALLVIDLVSIIPYLAGFGGEYIVWLTAVSVPIVFVAFFVMNRFSMANRYCRGAMSNDTPSFSAIPGDIKRHNTLLTVIFVIFASLLSAVPFLSVIFGQVFSGVLSSIAKLLSMIQAGEGNLHAGEYNTPTPTPEPTGDNATTDIMTYIFIGLAVIVVALFTPLVFRGIKGLVRYIMGLFKPRTPPPELDYVETVEEYVEDVPQEKLKGGGFFDRFRRGPRYGDCKSNSDRVRFIFKHLVVDHMEKGYTPQKSETSTEVLNDIASEEQGVTAEYNALAEAYAKARYSGQEPPDDITERLKNEFIKGR